MNHTLVNKLHELYEDIYRDHPQKDFFSISKND